MKELLEDGLKVFIIAMLVVLAISGALAAGGKFDSWPRRRVRPRKKKRMDYH